MSVYFAEMALRNAETARRAHAAHLEHIRQFHQWLQQIGILPPRIVMKTRFYGPLKTVDADYLHAVEELESAREAEQSPVPRRASHRLELN